MTTATDAAVLAYRENPTEENRLAILAAMAQHNGARMARDADEYRRRVMA